MLLLHFLLNHSHIIKDVTVVFNGGDSFLIIILQLLFIKELFYIPSPTLIILKITSISFTSSLLSAISDTKSQCLLQSAV